MNFSQKFNAIDNPSVPLLANITRLDIPVGKFIEPIGFYHSHDDLRHYSKGNFIARDLYLPRVTLRRIKGEFLNDVVLQNKRGDGENYFGSCFFLEGEMRTLLPGQEGGVEIYKGMSNLKYDPRSEFGHFCPASTPFDLFHFGMRTDFFLEILPQGEGWADKLRKRVENKERIMSEKGTAITAEQYRALQNIVDCQMPGTLRYTMMETYIEQIMLLQLHGLFVKLETGIATKFSRRDADLIHDVRTFILNNFLDDLSLTLLARNFGVNNNKLMNLFKAQFSVSIFEFISELKMDHARQLLKDGMSVAAVGSLVGYKNPHHFSTAFKRRFGINPSQLRIAA